MSEPAAANAPARPWWDPTPERANVVALALLVLITLPMLTKIFTSDFGTHIALGREIVQTLRVSDKEFLNYPSLGMNNPNGEWGFEAVLYCVFSVGGVYGVSLFIWAVVFGIFFFLYRSTVLRGANPILAALTLFAFSGFLRIRIQPRPEIFTYLFSAFTIYVLSEYYHGSRKKLIYVLPPLILLWANCHPTYLMAFLLFGAFFVDALARAAWNREFRWDRLKEWVFPPVVAGALGLALCGLNPHGYTALLLPLHLLDRGVAGGGTNTVLMSISELTPVKGTGMYVYFQAAVGFAVVSLALGAIGRRVYLLDLFFFAIAFKGAWGSARAVSMMGLFLSPGASLHITGFLLRVGEWFSPKAARAEKPVPSQGKGKKLPGGAAGAGAGAPKRSLAPWLAAGTLSAALVVFGAYTLSFSFSQLEYGVGMTEHKFSFKAAQYLRENPVPGKMFNFFDIGGFLDWQLYPQALTFIDGRTYNGDVFMDHQMVTGGMPGWEKVLDKYGVTYVVLKTMDSSGMILPILPALSNHPDWSLVFADGLFVVFVKKASPELGEYVRRHEIPRAILPQHVIWEAYHYMFLGVSPVLAYNTMSNMYLVMGNRPGAIDALRTGISATDDPYLRERLMQLEQGGSQKPRHP